MTSPAMRIRTAWWWSRRKEWSARKRVGDYVGIVPWALFSLTSRFGALLKSGPWSLPLGPTPWHHRWGPNNKRTDTRFQNPSTPLLWGELRRDLQFCLMVINIIIFLPHIAQSWSKYQCLPLFGSQFSTFRLVSQSCPMWMYFAVNHALEFWCVAVSLRWQSPLQKNIIWRLLKRLCL